MTEAQGNDLINAVNGVRTDLSSVRADLAALRADVQGYHPYALGSTYVISTSVGIQDLRIERSVTVGDIVTSLLMVSLLLVVGVKYLFGAFRGVGL
jgi:hypothetical protein